MSYTISPYAHKMAKKIGVTLKPSTVKNKKIDVFKDDHKIASIGQLGMKDYQLYLKEDGKEVADERRKAYHSRHKRKTLNELLSLQLLW